MTQRSLFFALTFLALAWVVGMPTAWGAPPTDCKTPRHAVDSVFAGQQANTKSLEFAARCLDPEGRSAKELQKVAVAIKAVYDAKVAYVVMDQISDDGNYKDDSGKEQVVPHEKLPDVVVAKNAKGDWIWTRASLDRVVELHTAIESETPIDDKFLERIPPSLRGKVLGVEWWQYLAILLIFVVGLIARKIISFVVKNRVRRLVENLGQTWATGFVDVFASPGATLVMAIILQLSYPQLRLPIKAALAMAVAVRVLVVLSIVWAAYRLVDVVAARMSHKAEQTDSKLDDQLVPLVRKGLKVITVVVGGLFILQNLSVDVSSLLAGLGIGGLAFALAAKDTLANFFGSVMIFVDRPFQIGDWVIAGGKEGVVEEVGFRSTRLRTFYNSLMTIPNAKITDTHIDNYGERRYRRCSTTLGLTYDTTPEQMQAFVEGVRAIIQANPHTRKDAYEVHMSGFGDSSLNVMLYFFFEVESWTIELREKHNVFLEIMRLAEKLGVSFAFPTSTLHVAEVPEPGERQLAAPLEDEALAATVESFGPEGDVGRPGGPKLTQGYWPKTIAARGSSEDDDAA